MTTPGPLSHKAQQTLVNLAKMHADGDTSKTVTRPNAVTLGVYRALERRGLIQMETTDGTMSLKTGAMSWNFRVTITEAGLDSVAPNIRQ